MQTSPAVSTEPRCRPFAGGEAREEKLRQAPGTGAGSSGGLSAGSRLAFGWLLASLAESRGEISPVSSDSGAGREGRVWEANKNTRPAEPPVSFLSIDSPYINVRAPPR